MIDRAAHQPSDLDAEHGNHGDHRVAVAVADHHQALDKPLGAGRGVT